MPTPGLIPQPLTEVSEGGIFGPSSFEGYPIEAAFTLHRMSSSPPTPEQEKKMLSGEFSAGYTLALWVKFRVTQALEPSNWDGEEFEHTWSLGKTAALNIYPCSPPDISIPCGFPAEGSDIGGGRKAPNPFEALGIYAKGIFEVQGKQHILTLDGDPAKYRGRWYQSYKDGKPSSDPYNLNSKCSFIKMCDESAEAIKETDPSLVLSKTDLKTEKVRNTLNIWIVGPDGDPYGAEFFVGLAGTWDTKSFEFEMKGKTDKGEQKVLYLSNYTGRVEVSKAGTPPAQAAAGKSGKGKGKAATPASAPASAPATPDTDTTPDTLDEKLLALILKNLPTDGHIAELNLAKAVLVGNFTPTEIPAAQARFMEILRAAPDSKDAAQTVALIDPENVPFFVYDPKLKQVTRYTTA